MADDLLERRREDAITALLHSEQSLDFERLVEVFPHPRYELIGNGRVYDGLGPCSRYLKERHNAFPDYTVDVIALHHASAAVIAECWVSGTHVGSIEGIDPTRRGFRMRMASFFLFDGSTLTGVRNYFDHASVARQLA